MSTKRIARVDARRSYVGTFHFMTATLSQVFESAVTIIPEEELRAFVLRWGRGSGSDFRDALVTHAARAKQDWPVPHTDPTLCDDARALVAAASRGNIEPHQMDDIFRRAGRVFVAGHSQVARDAYETVLRPLSKAEIGLPGVDEFSDEVLSSSMYDVCSRYLVATYESTPADKRVEALVDTLEVLDGLQHLEMPIRMMESAATRPLEDFDGFVGRWLARLRKGGIAGREWASRTMVQEAILRSGGIEGLQREARTTGTAESYRAWCHALRQERRWPELLVAVEEALTVAGCAHEIASYHEECLQLKAVLGRTDGIREHLEAAFRSRPTMGRMLRLIDHECPAGAVLRDRARNILEQHESDQEIVGILHVIAGNYQDAVELLENAWRGGWRRNDVLFASLVCIAGGKPPVGSPRARLLQCIERVEPGLLEYETPDQRLPTTPIVALLDRCGDVGNVPGTLVLEALRATAWRRIDAVTSEKHRSQYAHGALLAACAAELQSALGDPSGASSWMDQVRQDTRYLPRFQRELAALWPWLA